MAPKKSGGGASSAAPAKIKVEVPLGGLHVDSCTLPLWDETELEREVWGDLSVTHVDPSSLYTDNELPVPIVSTFATVAGLEWRRPSAVFSPFKPVVFRPTLHGNPYEFVASSTNPQGPLVEDDDDESSRLQSRAEIVAAHRSMKLLRSGGAEDDVGVVKSPRRSHASTSAKRRDRSIAPTPFFMRAFNSALMVLNQAQTLVPPGSYAWELIHPQGTAHAPIYNPSGKYWVKLYVDGAFRRIVLDDRLPTDAFGQCLLTVTENKEIWPALLAKAMLKALGPKHESLVFYSPTFIVQTLLGAWVPQYTDPRREEALAFRALRSGMVQIKEFAEAQRVADAAITRPTTTNTSGSAQTPPATPSDGHRPVGCLLVATCNDGTVPQPAQTLIEEHAVAAGLHCNQAFYIMDVRPYQNTTLLRLCSPGAAWKGSYGYDSAVWTSEFEDEIGFSKSKDRNPVDLLRKWNDFWMPWDSFVKFFNTLVVFRNTTSRSAFGFFKQIQYSESSSQNNIGGEAASAQLGKSSGKPAAASGPGALLANQSLHETRPKTMTRWLYFNNDAPMYSYVVINGLPMRPAKEAAGDGADSSRTSAPPSVHGSLTTTVTVCSYSWNKPDPFVQVLRLTATDGLTATASFLAPSGQRAFRVVVNDLYAGMVVSVLAGHEFHIGDQKEICRDLLGVHSFSDAGIYSEHRPDMPTIWFKRFFTVKQPATANFAIGTLPRGTDLTLHRSAQLDAAPPSGTKGGAKTEKAKPPPKKGGEPPPGESLSELVDDEVHEHPITDYVHLSVIDMDTGVATLDTVGKIMRMALQPNKSGYIVMARATTPEHYGRGYWRLQCASDKPFEQFEVRHFEEVQVRQGTYSPNDTDTLFRYIVATPESASTTIQLVVMRGVPLNLSLFHNDKLIAQQQSQGGAHIDHVTLIPSDKAAPSVYVLQCTLSRQFAAGLEARRLQSVIDADRRETAEQTQRLRQRQEQLRELLLADPNAKLPPPQESPAAVVASLEQPGTSDAASLGFVLSFHSSTAKLDVKEDNTINDATAAMKLAWSKKEDAAVSPPAKGSKAAAGKGHNPVVDEATLRFAKAKEARERYLANREGVFMPYLSASNGKLILQPDQEDFLGYRNMQPTPTVPLDCASRLHMGFTATGGNLHGGLCGTDERLSSGGSTTGSGPQTLVKPQIKEVVDHLQTDLVPAMKEQRRLVFAKINDITTAYFAEIKPVAAPLEPAEDEKKKGKTSGGGGASKK